MPAINTDQLRAMRQQLDDEHARLWREISMSEAWRKLTMIEAQLATIAELLKEDTPPADPPAA